MVMNRLYQHTHLFLICHQSISLAPGWQEKVKRAPHETKDVKCRRAPDCLPQCKVGTEGEQRSQVWYFGNWVLSEPELVLSLTHLPLRHWPWHGADLSSFCFLTCKMRKMPLPLQVCGKDGNVTSKRYTAGNQAHRDISSVAVVWVVLILL